MKEFPKRYTRFILQDFHQIDVDDFYDGDFMFSSAKEIKVKTNDDVNADVISVEEIGWIVKVYDYNNHYYVKILICDYTSKPWHNNYVIKGKLCRANDCDYWGDYTLEGFLEWIEIK